MKFLTAVEERCEPFQNITLNVKRFQYSPEKHCKRGDGQYNNFHRITHKTIFELFDFQKYFMYIILYNVPRIFWKHYFMITGICQRINQHVLLSSHTLLTQKQLFHRELFKKFFPLKCFLNVY